MLNVKVKKATSINGTIDLPGDKSISHRSAMLASLARGRTTIDNFAASLDCASTLGCLRALGVEITRDGDTVIVDGAGTGGFTTPTADLDCGNSGTTMRLLSGILAGQGVTATLIGDASLSVRPMQRVINPLESMGATIRSVSGHPPLAISARRPLTAIDYQTPVASAQIKSCILLAGLGANGETAVIETVQTRDHTERMLRWFGVDVVTAATDTGWRTTVRGGSRLTARDLSVPADISSAAFFMVGAAGLPASDIILPNVGINPTRRAILDVLVDIGADVAVVDPGERCNEPVAALRVRGGISPGRSHGPAVLQGKVIANLIDEIPILAVMGTRLEHGLEVRDAAELRVKESDRIRATVDNLRRMGAAVTEYEDGFRVERSQLSGAEVESYGDHRIAMAFAVAGLFADGETTINGSECVDVSFPGFFDVLGSVVTYSDVASVY